MLAEISSVCDIRTQEDRLNQSDKQVLEMQRIVTDPLKHLLQAVAVRDLNLHLFKFLFIYFFLQFLYIPLPLQVKHLN